jgi:RNA polymerase sigma-70 factor (ECF subfamily)
MAIEPDSIALDREDMGRLTAGHDAALNNLMERHGPAVFHYLIRVLHNEEDAADLAQETFVRVYQHRDKFDPKQKFSTWLYTIATNLARDRQRWRMRHPTVPLEPANEEEGSVGATLAASEPDALANLEQAERAAMVREAIAGLPEELRVPLVLAEYEDLSQAEIAATLRCTVKAVESKLYRARNQLRGRMERWLKTV